MTNIILKELANEINQVVYKIPVWEHSDNLGVVEVFKSKQGKTPFKAIGRKYESATPNSVKDDIYTFITIKRVKVKENLKEIEGSLFLVANQDEVKIDRLSLQGFIIDNLPEQRILKGKLTFNNIELEEPFIGMYSQLLDSYNIYPYVAVRVDFTYEKLNTSAKCI